MEEGREGGKKGGRRKEGMEGGRKGVTEEGREEWREGGVKRSSSSPPQLPGMLKR